ncbi:MAG: hypothetical protein RLZZ127_558, partial [Planctomycetota bacterium]
MTTISSDRFEALVPAADRSRGARLAALERALHRLQPADGHADPGVRTPAQAAADRELVLGWAATSLAAILPMVGMGFFFAQPPLLAGAILLVGCAAVPVLARRSATALDLRSAVMIAIVSALAFLGAGMAGLVERMAPGSVSAGMLVITLVALAGALATLVAGLRARVGRHAAEHFLAWAILLAAGQTPG